MTIRTHYFAAAAAIGALAAPAVAQYAQQTYPQSYPQQSYPQQYAQPYSGYAQPAYGQPGYAQPAYGYNQGYNAQNPVGQIIDSLLGNRYNVNDRQAVSRCASAATTQAEAQYRGRYNQGYGTPGYGQGYNNGLRVTAITDVQRRSSGLRVKGTLSSGGYHGHYGQTRQYAGDVTFRCNVAYNGAVTDIRIGGYSNGYRR